MSKVSLVLVGAKSYTYIPLGLSPIIQGETIEVDSPIAEELQSLFVVDAAHGKREIFVSPDHPRALRFAENQEATGTPVVKESPPRKKADEESNPTTPSAAEVEPEKKPAPRSRRKPK